MKKIFKIIVAVIVLTTASIQLNAQVDTSTTQKLLQYIFQPIDKNQIPTGFLEEYGCPMLPATTFNGTLIADSMQIRADIILTGHSPPMQQNDDLFCQVNSSNHKN